MNPLRLEVMVMPTVLFCALNFVFDARVHGQPASTGQQEINMGLNEATAAQLAALAQMNNSFTELSGAVGAARAELTSTIYLSPGNRLAINAATETVIAAEATLAAARAEAFAQLQSQPESLSPSLSKVLIWQAIRPEVGRRRATGGGRGGPPAAPAAAAAPVDGFSTLSLLRRGDQKGPLIASLSDLQQTAVTRLDELPGVESLRSEVAKAKRAVYEQVYFLPLDPAAYRTHMDTWRDAEIRLAQAKASAFVEFQAASPYRLNADQIQTLANGTTGGQGLED
jgi:hypothetical protein